MRHNTGCRHYYGNYGDHTNEEADGMADKTTHHTDLRVRKTYKALLGALYGLLCEKSMDDISVTELCDRAEIRKATFYKHFASKYDLLSYMVENLQDSFGEKSAEHIDPERPETFHIAMFANFLDFMEENETLVASALNSKAKYVILDLIIGQMEEYLTARFREEIEAGHREPGMDPDMLAALYSGAIVSCARWWFAQEPRPSKIMVVRQFGDLIGRL